ncbi:DNA adenine methylase [Olivibacter sp. LS-1]|uniref:DNA adenine methylase n=1 Tax=Olivibacter sp. LS-1 TaxID=2592345 RepID=UPI0011EB4B9C|nr:DNA adenine methylase [Olivibacter sp. LS-1]QEL01552.1 DNA adenine methylase [Olivibacter sp. LS-1]
MKTPISYYGGKQNLIREILPLIPSHKQYVEPFIGGAAVLFAKRPSEHEVINDFDNRLITFWKVLKYDFHSLQSRIRDTLHSESQYKESKHILKNMSEYSDLDIAWAYWVNTQMAFSFKLLGGFAFEQTDGRVKLALNKKIQFTDRLRQRLQKVEIFNRDAIDLIKRKDSKNTFFYLDPPYAESDCGTYDKLKEVYYRLLDLLPSLKGKWLMSSYPSQQLTDLRKECGWHHKDIDQNLSVSGKHTIGKRKVECLTYNYELNCKQQSIFDVIREVS